MKFNKFILFTSVGLISILSLVYFIYYSYQKKSLALQEKEISFNTQEAIFKHQSKTNKINQFAYFGESNTKKEKSLYSFASNQKKLGIAAFANKNIKNLVDEETINQMKLKSKITDGSEHFYYEQNLKGIPVYGSHLMMHVNSSGEIYGLNGNLTKINSIPLAKISTEEAQEIALAKAKAESKQTNLHIYLSEKFIFNKKIMGLDEDENNYLVLAVWIKNEENTFPLFSTKYYVDLFSKKILYSENQLIYALNRIIQGIKNNNAIYNIMKEGDAAVSDSSANKAYKSLKIAYDFYKNTYNLDSYDGNGATLYGVVHVKEYCPNAFFSLDDEKIYLCDNMIVDDIITHEMGHAVTLNKLGFSYQTGAINEGVSDTFAHGVDPGDWILGEDTGIDKVIRYTNDPTKTNDPDRLFSNNYYCDNSDYGGIHSNLGIINKMFYLISEGGSFNGCNLAGIGTDKALQIVYRAVKIYMSPTGNFRSMYEAMVTSCNDLYGSSTTDCSNVIRAMQATEIDQQPANTQTGPYCSQKARQTPGCVGTNPPTASTPTPTTITSTPINTPIPSATKSPQVSSTPTPTLPQKGNTTVNLNLKFQGITSQPSNKAMRVKITLVSENGDKFISQVDFVATVSGVWTGKAYFDFENNDIQGKLFNILVKGPKHIQKRICDASPTESEPGYYQCSQSKITLVKGANNFNFSNIMLLSGDLPVQDGLINSYDLSLIRQYLGSVESAANDNADINLDGVINTQDYSLVIYSLSTKFDD